MKILVIGRGGREHSLVWKLSQNPNVEKIFCIPGNAGISQLAECQHLPIDRNTLASFAYQKNIDLTVVGPEASLVEGIVDKFRARKLNIFGPCEKAAKIEGSKSFAKELMKKYKIPTAKFKKFDNPNKAKNYIEKYGTSIVVKADGLAEGKGSIVCSNKEEAHRVIQTIMIDKKFGKSGNKIVIEEFLQGPETTLMVFTDGKTILPLELSQDYKPIYDNDKGPNTGGMGCYSPVPIFNQENYKEAVEIAEKSVQAMAAEGIEYKGILYLGLMLTKNGWKVIEYNCRFGDPEAQAVLPRLKTDLVEILQATIDSQLNQISIDWASEKCVCVVASSKGYPGKPETGFEITGLEEASEVPGVTIFHAGTALNKSGKIVTAGGRVLNISATGKTFKQAIDRAYKAIEMISFKDSKMHFRTDIGKRAIQN